MHFSHIQHVHAPSTSSLFVLFSAMFMYVIIRFWPVLRMCHVYQLQSCTNQLVTIASLRRF